MTRARIATTAAYAVQGFGFAVVLTSIPGYKERLGMGDDVVTLVVLGVCVFAGLGSALSGVVAALRGARAVVVGGLLLAALAVAGVGLAPSWPAFFVAIGLYGLALGAVDAAMNMLGIDVERAHGRSLLASFFAANAAGGVLGALAVSGSALVGLGQPVALPLVALLVAAGAVWLALRLPDGGTTVPGAVAPGGTPGTERPTEAGPVAVEVADDGRGVAALGTVPWVAAGTIALLGAGMLAFPVADSDVSSWSATFLRDVLAASAAAAPLGYAAYQAALIVSRLVGDGLVERLGRVRVVRLGARSAPSGSSRWPRPPPGPSRCSASRRPGSGSASSRPSPSRRSGTAPGRWSQQAGRVRRWCLVAGTCMTRSLRAGTSTTRYSTRVGADRRGSLAAGSRRRLPTGPSRGSTSSPTQAPCSAACSPGSSRPPTIFGSASSCWLRSPRCRRSLRTRSALRAPRARGRPTTPPV